MFEAKDILTFLGIPGDKIKYFDIVYDGDDALVRIELEDIRGYCPKCGSTNLEIKDYYTVHINNSIIKHRNFTVEIKVRRYKCQKCGKTFKQKYEFVEKGNSISIAVKGQIIEDLKERITNAQIARDHNVSPMTVMRIFDNAVLPQLPLKLSEIICVDEFCYKHSNCKEGKYPVVITNPLNGKIIDIIYSRWKNILIEYFNKVKIPERHNVKYFVGYE